MQRILLFPLYVLTNMSISNNNKSLDKCIFRILNCVAMKHDKSKPWLLHRHVSSQWLLSGHMSAQYIYTVWSYVCSVCTERTVLLVPLNLLGIVNMLDDTSPQIKVTMQY